MDEGQSSRPATPCAPRPRRFPIHQQNIYEEEGDGDEGEEEYEDEYALDYAKMPKPEYCGLLLINPYVHDQDPRVDPWFWTKV